MTLAQALIEHHVQLGDLPTIPEGVDWILPYEKPELMDIFTAFHERYYPDSEKRDLILGINPGRLGTGQTSLPFTDPPSLEKLKLTKHELSGAPELSAQFIHAMIAEAGGYRSFFSKYYVSSICPLGFTKDGINYNYYDHPDLQQSVSELIDHHLLSLLKILNPDQIIILGKGKNARYFRQWVDRHAEKRSASISILPHPRWIMQYRRKAYREHMRHYLEVLS